MMDESPKEQRNSPAQQNKNQSAIPKPMGAAREQNHFVMQAQYRQSVYPPPEDIERYEKIAPGTWSRILTMAEDLQKAQIDANGRAIEYMQKDMRRGHYLGFAVSLVAILTGSLLAYNNHDYVAGLCFSVPIMAVARELISSASKNATPSKK